MAGIVSFGAYVPPTRLGFSVMAGRAPKDGGPERAVAWNDEDAVTMGVTAAVNCLRGFDRASVDALVFASTTYAFKEKQAAALVAKALDLRRDVRTTDVSGSLRAGTDALHAALDAVTAGSAKRVLVVASDCRLGAPGSALEQNFGDGAAAFLVGGPDAVAAFEGAFAIADEIVDVWRGEGDPFVHSWEERFVVQEGYTPGITEVVRGLLAKLGAKAGDFTRVALFGPDARSHQAAARALKIDAGALVDPLFGKLGNAGVAFTPLLLASALESAKQGDRILLAGYGDGGEAMAFSVTDHIGKLEPRRGVAWHLARRRAVASYDRYRAARGLDAKEYAPGRDPGLSATIHFREREEDVAFKGQKCSRCGGVQFPLQRVCERCFAKDDFELVRLSDRVGTVQTYTFDFFFPTPDPPTVVTVTEIDGARVHLQLVNVKPEQVRIGLPVEFEFRRIHQAGGRPNYYWKGVPIPE
ncbi:MAG TPA: 3-oxoacyl-[acyl-carrier-protein] synthase III C-terminal domain-containing protein [Myxococcota bacterium]|nr:3-oxoacyl-[acyl-carrier-protein] synthase III C-terminal domain-containing protein [Myxococcota bacterium]